MPAFTALLHTLNDARRLGRPLETLFPCAEILVVDHGSVDSTIRVAHRYGARVVGSVDGASAEHYVALAACSWIFCLDATESFTEGLQAALFEWGALPEEQLRPEQGFRVAMRGQTGHAWEKRGPLETRLVPKNWSQWNGWVPADDPEAPVLEGELLRLALP